MASTKYNKKKNYTKETDKICRQKPGTSNKHDLTAALQICDFQGSGCQGILDEKCDGSSIKICEKVSPAKTDNETINGCTYVKKGINGKKQIY